MNIKDLITALCLTGITAGSQAAAIPLETIVVTGSRHGALLKDQAGNTTVLSDRELAFIRPSHIQESLVRVAGANLARGNGQEYLPALRSPVLTGAGACGSVLSAVDGIPLRAAGFCNINELFETPSELAERIEVVRGPATALYGSNAMTGMINVITPKVTADRQIRWSIEGGPHDYVQFKSSISGWQGEHGLRADLLMTHDDGYRDNSGFDQQKLLLRHEYGQEAVLVATTLSLTNLNQETAGYVIGTDAYKDRQLRDSNPNPEAYRDAHSARLATRMHYQLADGEELILTPYLRYTEMEFLQHFLPGQPLEKNGQTSVGLQSSYYRDFEKRLSLVAGVDLEYTNGYLKQAQANSTQGSAFLQATIPKGNHYDYEVDALMVAPFVQANWSITGRLSLTAGLRYELMDYDYDNRMLAGRTADDGKPCGFGGCRYSRPADREDRFENWSPKLGLLYDLSDQQQIYLNVSRGFRAPQATELYRLERDQIVADLDSENADSIELGFRGQQRQLTYEVIAFAMRQRNIIFRDSDFFNVADGETHHKGMELMMNYTFNPKWDISVSASYAEHEYRDDRLLSGVPIDGHDVDSAPRHFGSVQLGWNLSKRGRIEFEWLHQSSYYTDPENQHDYEGHDLLNLRTRLQLNKSLSLSARVTNLTNVKYAERADYSNFSGDRYFPGEPRALYIGIAMQY